MRKASDHGMKPDARKISRKLKLKQRRFVAEFTNPEGEGFGNLTKAAELAGYEPTSARNQGHRLMKNDDVKTEVELVLEQGGATREKAARVVSEAMDADVTRVFCPGEGELVYADPMPDHPTRLKAAEMSHKLRGDFPTPNEQERIRLLQLQQNILIVPPISLDKPKDEEIVRKVPE